MATRGGGRPSEWHPLEIAALAALVAHVRAKHPGWSRERVLKALVDPGSAVKMANLPPATRLNIARSLRAGKVGVKRLHNLLLEKRYAPATALLLDPEKFNELAQAMREGRGAEYARVLFNPRGR